MKIRTNDPQYVEWSRQYIEQVYKQVGDLQVTKGGPLLMVQIENEYGNARPANNDYMVSLHKIFQDVGFDVQMFICDPPGTAEWRNPAFRLPGVMNCLNGLKSDANYNGAADAIGDYPTFVPEVYTAWFSAWGQPIATPQQHHSQHYGQLAAHVPARLQMFFFPLYVFRRNELRLLQRLCGIFSRANKLQLRRAD